MDSLTCDGRAQDDQAQLVGPPCGRTIEGTMFGTAIERARAAGWKVGPLQHGRRHAMCDQCGRPDRAITTGLAWKPARPGDTPAGLVPGEDDLTPEPVATGQPDPSPQ
jgi:hypothetical protein